MALPKFIQRVLILVLKIVIKIFILSSVIKRGFFTNLSLFWFTGKFLQKIMLAILC